MQPITLSLGALQYCWEKPAVEAFYQQVAESKIQRVYLGEIVCPQRRLLKFKDYFALAQLLREAGKEVVLSTLTLVQHQAELKDMRKVIDNGEFMVEANDMGGVLLAHEQQVPFVGGADLNLYNASSIRVLQKYGMQRFLMPVELSAKWLAEVQPELAAMKMDVEVFGYGYLPLAHSARCYTARYHQKTRIQCDTICQTHPQGIMVRTQENQALLRLNGLQTQSSACVDLQTYVAQMQALGVQGFRLSAHNEEVIAYANALATQQAIVVQGETCQGYWLGKRGIDLAKVG